MVARCTFVEIKPEDVDQCVKIFHEQVLPAIADVDGFRGAFLLTHPDDGKTIVVDLCDSHEQAIANEQNGIYQREVARFADKFIGTPRREIYDVSDIQGVISATSTGGSE